MTLLNKMKMMMKNEKLSDKQNDVLEFIRIALLRPEQIDALLPRLIEFLSGYKTPTNVEKIQENVKERILSDAFLEKFIPNIEDIFSHEEIKRLIQFYKDPAIKKFFEKGGGIGPIIYSSFNGVIQSILGSEA